MRMRIKHICVSIYVYIFLRGALGQAYTRGDIWTRYVVTRGGGLGAHKLKSGPKGVYA